MPEQRHSEGSGARRRRDSSPLRKSIRMLEGIGGGLLCLLAAMTPWLFGTTENWSVRLMNMGSFVAGAILATTAILNRFAKGDADPRNLRDRVLALTFLALNIAVLGFCAIAWWNARATFSVEERSFTYRDDYNPALPTTYDANLTAQTFTSFLACFVVFWSLRSWLLRGNRSQDRDEAGILGNKRFQLFVWVLSLNGLAIALQGILQRLSGSSKLLWMRESWWDTVISCFGPFSYRGNAAEYLNLLWPVAVGFWWALSRERRRRMGSSRLFTDGPELLLIPATIVMVAASFITLSRGGAVISLAIVLGIGGMFFFQKNVSWQARLSSVGFIAVVLLMVWFLGGKGLRARFRIYGLSNLAGREEIYLNAKQMAADYPRFGTGPGSFRSVYHLYRQETKELWHGFLHDDWMETRVTFGWVGLALVIANLGVLAFWIWSAGRPHILYVFPACASLGLIGALGHAKFDFPFQTYSILFTFVVICAVLTSLSPTRK